MWRKRLAALTSLGATCALRAVNWPQHAPNTSECSLASGGARQNRRKIRPRKAEEKTELERNAPGKPIYISPAMSIARCAIPPFPGPLWGWGHCAYEERVSMERKTEGGGEELQEEGKGKGKGRK